MVVQLDPKHVQQSCAPLQPQSKASTQNQAHYCSTLVSSKDNVVVEYFWKAYNAVKWIFSSTWSWIAWLFQGCPVEASRLDMMEEILEAPEAQGKELAKNPQPVIADIIAAVFDDPAEFESLLAKDKNQEKFDKFLKAFKDTVVDGSSLFSKAKDVYTAFISFVNGKSSTNNVFKFLVDLLKDNTPLLIEALENIREQVLKIAQAEGGTASNECSALKGVFGEYLPKVIQTAKDNPESLQNFIKEFFKQRNFSATNTVALILAYLHPSPNSEEQMQLNACLGNNALVLRELSESHLLGVQGAQSIDIRKAFFKELLKAMKPEHINSLKEIIEKESQLGSEVFKRFIEFVASPAGKEKFNNNLPKALPVLEKLYANYQSK